MFCSHCGESVLSQNEGSETSGTASTTPVREPIQLESQGLTTTLLKSLKGSRHLPLVLGLFTSLGVHN